MPKTSDKHHFAPTLVIGFDLPDCNNIAINTGKQSEKEKMT